MITCWRIEDNPAEATPADVAEVVTYLCSNAATLITADRIQLWQRVRACYSVLHV